MAWFPQIVLAASDPTAPVTESVARTRSSRDSAPVTELGEAIVDAGVLQIKPVVEVDGTHDVMVSDLVEARGVRDEVIQALRDVRLSDAPRAGEARHFSGEDLSQTLRASLREYLQRNGELPRLRIPSRVTVTRRSLKIRTEDVQKAITSQFKIQCPDCEFEFTRFTMPLLPKFIEAQDTWNVQVRPDLPKGGFSIALEIKSPPVDLESSVSSLDSAKSSSATTSESKIYWISGQVAIRRRGAVASRSAQIGEKLQAEDFEVKLHDVTFSNDTPATALEVTTSVLSRPLAAGEVIWRSQLRREMAIKNGDPVRVTAGSSEWQVTIEGISQSSGYVGDSIRVKIPRTQKMVSGILREKGVVEIQ